MSNSKNNSSSLNVYWEGAHVGTLHRGDGDSLAFEYASTWLDAGRPAISYSLPLRTNRFEKEAHHFFGNLLPEGDFRRKIENLFRVSTDNDFSLLNQIAGDCAGALSIGVESEDEGGFYEEISQEELKRIIYSEGVSGIIQPGHHNRLSLAGAQGKLPVRFRDKKFEMPHAGAASTHIIKFNRRSESYPKLVENEYFATAVAKNMGLKSITAYLQRVEKESILVSERYDRSNEEWPRKYHQEDFCQILGFSYQKKYEKEGGPNFASCISFAREHLNLLAVGNLIDWFLFNFMMGNSDAHAKNISIIYLPGEAPQLTPFYDLVCTRAYANVDRHLAMAFGGEFDPDLVAPRHLDILAEQLDVSGRFVRSRFKAMFKNLLEAMVNTGITMNREGIVEKELQFVLQPLSKIHRNIENRFSEML